MLKHYVIRALGERQSQPVGRCDANQRRPPDLHTADGVSRFIQAVQAQRSVLVRQYGLVNDLDSALVGYRA